MRRFVRPFLRAHGSLVVFYWMILLDDDFDAAVHCFTALARRSDSHVYVSARTGISPAFRHGTLLHGQLLYPERAVDVRMGASAGGRLQAAGV
jgi:hypothetical protein